MERTRFAPSPTGMLHIGGARTALWAYLLAKQTGGRFVLRIEDTDQARSVDGGIENIVDTLHALGIDPDEGSVRKDGVLTEVGDFGPYQQSKRLDIYAKYAHQLIEQGHAYKCFCTRERLDEVRKEQQANKQQPKYDRHCLGLTDEEVEEKLKANTPYVVRMKVPEGKSTVQDIIRGDVTFDHKEVDDQVILKSDGFPTYHLAVVVDDHHMEVTTVIRGEEWLPSTPKHQILYNMLGWEEPKFAHVPLLLNPDKSKLSKRQGDVAAEVYLAKGYLPDALVNFIGTLGYNPTGDREIYSRQELIDLFNLSKVKKSGAVVNFEKLDWMNKQYMQELTEDQLEAILKKQGSETTQTHVRLAKAESSRAVTTIELSERIEPFIRLQEYDSSLLVWKKSDATDAREMLKVAHDYIAAHGDADDLAGYEASMKEWINEQGIGTGNILWPVRIALAGQKVSPSPFELIWALGTQEALSRIQTAIQKLETNS